MSENSEDVAEDPPRRIDATSAVLNGLRDGWREAQPQPVELARPLSRQTRRLIASAQADYTRVLNEIAREAAADESINLEHYQLNITLLLWQPKVP